jgi:hypothetical protein
MGISVDDERTQIDVDWLAYKLKEVVVVYIPWPKVSDVKSSITWVRWVVGLLLAKAGDIGNPRFKSDSCVVPKQGAAVPLEILIRSPRWVVRA